MSDAGVVLFTRSVQAQAEIEAMKALNEVRRRNGHADAYGEEAFLKVHEGLEIAIGVARDSCGWMNS